ncbi:MAG: L,D-transpeptidase family protein, partial [Halobacteriovoraceae bacterium]|nr:L,D-transpeptidase family protein [Halobacteriovoraceae bacterium]
MKSINHKLIILLTFVSIAPGVAIAKEYYPKAIVKLDDYFAHHVLVAEKSTHKLYLFGNSNGFPKLVKTYKMATGKKAGDKIFSGDHRTPEGVYFIKDFLPHRELINRSGKKGEMYGVGAFVLDYPNPIDLHWDKTGWGIWLHSTNDEARIEKGLDSRGCVVTANRQLIDIAKYIELHRTPMIIVHDLNWLSEVAWKHNKNNIEKMVDAWIKAWQREDFAAYKNSYHRDFKDRIRGNLSKFLAYKKAVFLQAGNPQIFHDHQSILQGKDYAVVTFRQNYVSNTIKDIGKKTLYLKKDKFYNWKIFAEIWSKAGIGVSDADNEVAFRPSMRFFKTN